MSDWSLSTSALGKGFSIAPLSDSDALRKEDVQRLDDRAHGEQRTIVKIGALGRGSDSSPGPDTRPQLTGVGLRFGVLALEIGRPARSDLGEVQ